MSSIMMVSVIAFMLVVVPIWLVLHYRSKKELNQGLSQEEYNQLSELSEVADKMGQRIQNLESILDAETPDWRSKL